MTAPALDRAFTELDRDAIRELFAAMAEDRCPGCHVVLTRGDGSVWCANCDPDEFDKACVE